MLLREDFKEKERLAAQDLDLFLEKVSAYYLSSPSSPFHCSYTHSRQPSKRNSLSLLRGRVSYPWFWLFEFVHLGHASCARHQVLYTLWLMLKLLWQRLLRKTRSILR